MKLFDFGYRGKVSKPTPLIEAKRKLYALLLATPEHNLSALEIDLMFSLCKDKDMQAILNKKKD